MLFFCRILHFCDAARRGWDWRPFHRCIQQHIVAGGTDAACEDTRSFKSKSDGKERAVLAKLQSSNDHSKQVSVNCIAGKLPTKRVFEHVFECVFEGVFKRVFEREVKEYSKAYPKEYSNAYSQAYSKQRIARTHAHIAATSVRN